MGFQFDQPLQLIRLRHSCRRFAGGALPIGDHLALSKLLAALPAGPHGTRPRIELLAAHDDDAAELRGLGTYGFIQGAQAFAVASLPLPPGGDPLALAPAGLVDLGYVLEYLVLGSVELGLGSCWLGGSFSKSRFRAAIAAGDTAPCIVCVIALGRPLAGRDSQRGLLRTLVGGSQRKPWEELFSAGEPARPLNAAQAGPWEAPLEALRWAPSASNRQPWRVWRERPDGGDFRFSLERSPGYRSGVVKGLLAVPDLQVVDMGIALAHWELMVHAAGLGGAWELPAPSAEAAKGPAPVLAWWRGGA